MTKEELIVENEYLKKRVVRLLEGRVCMCRMWPGDYDGKPTLFEEQGVA